MPPEIHEPAPPATPWSGAAIAAGAVLAGLALGRSGRVGLAAGVAAAASVKLLNAGAGRRENHEAANGPASPIMLLMPPQAWAGEAVSPHAAHQDWVDSSAIVLEAEVPMTDEVRDLLKPKSLPLLDDDGVPIQEADFVRPGAEAEEPPTDFPFGPVIWDPAQMAQSSSAATSETVWFGMPDVPAPQKKETPQPEAPAPAISAELANPTPAASTETDTSDAPAMPMSPAPLHDEVPEIPLQVAVTPAPATAFSLDPDEDGEPTPTVEAPPAVAQHQTAATESAAPVSPVWLGLPTKTAPTVASAAFPLPTLPQPGPLPELQREVPDPVKIIPRSNGKTSLPLPRKNGEPPRHAPESHKSAESKTPAKEGRTLLAQITSSHGGAPTLAHRPAERRAVMPHPSGNATRPSTPWPKVLLFALVLISLFLAAAWWRDDVVERMRMWVQPDSARMVGPDDTPSAKPGGDSGTPWLMATPEP